MNNYIGSIDTDMAIGSILSNFETPWVIHSVQDSLNLKFRPFDEPMPNFVDIMNRQFDSLYAASPDYTDKVVDVKNKTFIEIIECICNYYNLSFNEPYENISPQELYGIAHTIYDIFISRFTVYMVDFFINYIINNMDSIYAYLMSDDTVKKPREKDMIVKSYIDPKFQIIHANLNKIILNMTSYDISFEMLMSYFVDPNTAARLIQILSDRGDIFKNHYAAYLLDNRYMAELLTCIKLKLQSRTQEAYQINFATPEPVAAPNENNEEGELNVGN